MGYEQGLNKHLENFITKFKNIWRILVPIHEHIISQVFVKNIILSLTFVSLHHIYELSMDMDYKLINVNKQWLQWKYSNMTKDNPKRSYPNKEYSKVNVAKVSIKEEPKVLRKDR